jgi:hypothetical protein
MARTPAARLLIDEPADVEYVARRLADGAVVGAAFANFYGIITRPDAPTVRGVNVAKGRPVDQVGSITTTRPRAGGLRLGQPARHRGRRLDPRPHGRPVAPGAVRLRRPYATAVAGGVRDGVRTHRVGLVGAQLEHDDGGRGT